MRNRKPSSARPAAPHRVADRFREALAYRCSHTHRRPDARCGRPQCFRAAHGRRQGSRRCCGTIPSPASIPTD
ncbi:MAG: phage DNA packaging protein J [Salinivirgaceae bacterium]|nr:phage DNA packaging protein J [Salinivirgaceae bacterium]